VTVVLSSALKNLISSVLCYRFDLDIRYGYILVCIYVCGEICLVRSGKRGIVVENRVNNRAQI